MPGSYLTEKERMALVAECGALLVRNYGSMEKVLDVIQPLSSKVLDVVMGQPLPVAYAAVRLACESLEVGIKESAEQRQKRRAK